MSQAIITANAVGHSFGDRQIFKEVDLSIHEGDRLALVGANGSGKSTLLRLLAGRESPTDGSIRRVRGSRISWLPQITPGSHKTRTVLEELAFRSGVARALERMDRETQRLVSGDISRVEAHGEAVEEWTQLGGPDFEARLGPALERTGIRPDWANRPLDTLSGGQLARINLATIHLSRLDVALLDEPGNHLDAEGLEMLVQLLPHAASSVVLVSHDRHLLDGFADQVIELNKGRARSYRGGWTAYLREKNLAKEQASASWEEATAEQQRLVGMERRIRQQGEIGQRRAKRSGETDKFIRHFAIQSAQKNTAASGIAKRIEHLEVPEKPWEEDLSNLLLDSAGQVHAPQVMTARELVTIRGGWRSKRVSFSLAPGERMLLTGPNGSGKSSLIGTLAGRFTPASGELRIPGKTRLVELAQQGRIFSEGSGDLADRFAKLGQLDQTSTHTALASMKLGPETARRDPASLSPGELIRAELALLAHLGAACLLLDEPSNHLDIEALEVLEQALEGWKGALVVASHDRAFREAIRFDRTLELETGRY